MPSYTSPFLLYPLWLKYCFFTLKGTHALESIHFIFEAHAEIEHEFCSPYSALHFSGFLYSDPLHLLCSSYLLCFNSKQERKHGNYWKQIILLHCCWRWPSKLTDGIFLEWVLALKSVGAFPLVKLHKHMCILRIRATGAYTALRVAITCRLRSSSLGHSLQTTQYTEYTTEDFVLVVLLAP